MLYEGHFLLKQFVFVKTVTKIVLAKCKKLKCKTHRLWTRRTSLMTA